MVQTYSWVLNPNAPPPPLVLKFRPSPRLDWIKWEQDFTKYAAAINLLEKPAEQQVHIFLKTIGPEAIDIFNQFNLTAEKRNDLTLIKEKFTEYFNRHLVFERYRFHRLYQRSYVSFDNFLSSVWSAADTCEFGEMKEDFIRDKLVVSIDSFEIRAKLLREPNLTMQKAIEICRREQKYPRQTYQQWQQTRRRRDEKKSKYQLLNKFGLKAGSSVQVNSKNLVKNEADVKTEQVIDATNIKVEVEDEVPIIQQEEEVHIVPVTIKQEPEETYNTSFKDAETRVMMEIDTLVKEISVPPREMSENATGLIMERITLNIV